jgi:hypothetical protein
MSRRDREALNRGLDAILPTTASPDEPVDFLGQIVESDRRRSGRTQSNTDISEEPEVMTSHNEIMSYDNRTIGQYDNKTIMQESHKTPKGERKAPRAEPGAQQPAESLLQSRVVEAKRMAASPTMTVTLRIPRDMNDWLDEYVHRAWPQRVRKQELVVEALRLLIARRGRPGEPILETDLFPEDTP